jgi:hypothetical protein
MTVSFFDENIVSDLHKDARGFRPTQYWWDQWTQCNDAQKQFMWDASVMSSNKQWLLKSFNRLVLLQSF